MTNVFEGADTVTCGNKEIKSITINGDSFYDKEESEE